MVERSSEDDWRATCSGCGEIIGAFEPVVLLADDGRATETSLGAARALPDHGEPTALFHDDCFRRPKQ